MVSKPFVRIDKKAIERLAKGAGAQAVVTGVASRIAAAAGDGAQVQEYVTDRAVASVGVPAGGQAADGRLSRAAAAAGITISHK